MSYWSIRGSEAVFQCSMFNFQCIAAAMYEFEALCDLMGCIDQLMKINTPNDLFPVHIYQIWSLINLLPGRPVEHHPGPGARAPCLPRAWGWPRSQAVSLHQLSQVRDPVISHPAPGTLALSSLSPLSLSLAK